MKHVSLLGSTLLLGSVIAMAASPTAPTYAKDIAPIIQRNCQVCHRPGEVAPMSLLSYKDVRPWAKSIKEKVLSREMPPWFAAPEHGQFSNDTRLSPKDIETLVAWIDGGVKEGDPADTPQSKERRVGKESRY